MTTYMKEKQYTIKPFITQPKIELRKKGKEGPARVIHPWNAPDMSGHTHSLFFILI